METLSQAATNLREATGMCGWLAVWSKPNFFIVELGETLGEDLSYRADSFCCAVSGSTKNWLASRLGEAMKPDVMRAGSNLS